ncbi:MAG: triose-phosphate isomerase [Saprospiraceae bacterium]
MKNINRRKIVAGNWKMNMNFQSGRLLIMQVRDSLGPTECQVILCPPSILLKTASNLIKDVFNMAIGAQDCHQEANGAYTGELSADMLQSVGAEYVILGHSERREYFGESDELLAKKMQAVLSGNLQAIFCCGEKLDARESGKHFEIVEEQLKKGLFEAVKMENIHRVIIAYEPVWAIGTGKTASPEQAQEMHAFIRKLLLEQYGEEKASLTPILYGGSCKPSNAKEIFSQEDVDGGLIGGASLVADDFVAIINSF